MTTPETTELSETKTKTTRPNRRSTNAKKNEPPSRASHIKPTFLRKSEAPALAPDGVPDCDDGPIGLAARRLAKADGGFRGEAKAPVPVDPNASLIDELERILRGDPLDEEEPRETKRRFPLFGDDPLAFFDDDAAPGDEEDRDAVLEESLRSALRSELAQQPRPVPQARAYAPQIYEDDDRDGFVFFDEEPPRTPDFWRSEEDLPARERGGRRQRRGLSRGYLTVSALLLLVAAGGVYSTIQLTGDPAAAVATAGDVAAASAFSPGPAARLVETTTETAPVVIETPLANEAPPTEEPDPVALAEAAAPAVEPEPEPRIVPLFREPDEPAAGAEAPMPEPEAAVAEAPAAEVAAVEPAAAPPEPVAEAPPPPPTPPAAVAGTNLARITDWVNLRASPSMNGQVILVIPLGETVELVRCPGWCEVIYDGNRGFVGPDFVDPI